ncbi:GSH-induced LITAF domain [Olea europaea subsp. europaea]|uniref:GSH-induced LITAF domain n=1 Tax=Olea europaea subsp. europaea TaxID=158383 RepID=A0A8S0TXS0_OLEEU|nr:GSH-induced LITAF domain [Olea europaea subsp. europaea]
MLCPYQSGAVAPNAVVRDQKGIPLQQTIYRDTPAPFNYVHCGSNGITSVK